MDKLVRLYNYALSRIDVPATQVTRHHFLKIFPFQYLLVDECMKMLHDQMIRRYNFQLAINVFLDQDLCDYHDVKSLHSAVIGIKCITGSRRIMLTKLTRGIIIRLKRRFPKCICYVANRDAVNYMYGHWSTSSNAPRDVTVYVHSTQRAMKAIQYLMASLKFNKSSLCVYTNDRAHPTVVFNVVFGSFKRSNKIAVATGINALANSENCMCFLTWKHQRPVFYVVCRHQIKCPGCIEISSHITVCKGYLTYRFASIIDSHSIGQTSNKSQQELAKHFDCTSELKLWKQQQQHT